MLSNLFIASDVDGCITTHLKHVIMNTDNQPKLCKSFSDRDSRAIRYLQQQGAKVILVSGDNRINPEWAKEHKIPFLYVPDNKNKYYELVSTYPEIYNKYFIYIGDGEVDIPCLKRANIALYPCDVSYAVKNAMKDLNHAIRMPVGGGAGVFDWVKEVLVKVI